MSTPTPAGSLRSRIEDVSRPLLQRLQALPQFGVPLITITLIAVGVLAPLAVGLVALALVLLFVGWIAYLSWPVASTGGRIWRVLILALLVALAVFRF
ncbi:MAG TPA: DUF6703 family protein [Propionibacteriaceae bacterium]|nr:DUF6703 family protein [Propionibacteriaceae bacterium]